MKAWLNTTRAKPQDALKFKEDWPKPVPTKDLPILIKVSHVALNPVWWKAISMFPSLVVKRPGIPESDLSGIVVGGLNLKNSGFKEGDQIMGYIPAESGFRKGLGALSEFTLVKPDWITFKPDSVPFEEAAGLTLTGLTAWKCLVDVGKLESGQRVLINGGSGGVGSLAIQIAKAKGAYVVTTCSSRTKSFVESLKPDEIINYQEVSLPDHLTKHYSVGSSKEFNLIFDTVGIHELYTSSPKYVAPHGHFVDVGADVHSLGEGVTFVWQVFNNVCRPRWLGGTPIKYTNSLVMPNKTNLEELRKLMDQGKLKVSVDSVHEFDRALDAYKIQMSNRSKGKVVIRVS